MCPAQNQAEIKLQSNAWMDSRKSVQKAGFELTLGRILTGKIANLGLVLS